MPQATILIGFAEAISAPEVAWSLVDGGFEVIAFARRSRASALRHSRHVVFHEITPPEVNLQDSISDLQALLTLLSATGPGRQRILLPLDDKALYLCSQTPLGPSWLLAGPCGRQAELALNKHLQVEAAQNAGFSVPKTRLARTSREVFEFAASESYPVILKPAECVPIAEGRVRGGRNWLCANSDELNHAVRQWKEGGPLLVQQFIAGTGEGIFGLATISGIRAWSAHRRLRMMNPEGSGSSACVSRKVPEEIKPKVEALIKGLQWRGLFMIEMLRDHFGTSWFVELNGRPWGSMALSRRQGLEYPSWHVNLALDPSSNAGLAVSSVPGMVCRSAGRELMHILFTLRGAKSKALNHRPSLLKTLLDVIRIHREDTFYNWRRGDSRVFFADCYYTIYDNLFKSKN
jgi:hypothetical protein